MRNSIAILAASLGLFSAGAFAQEPAAAEQIVLRVEQGQIMTSQGGEFVPAQTGTVLEIGDRIMVTEGASASVFFDESCFAGFSDPGVHVIARRCDVAGSESGMAGMRTPLIVGGAAAVVAIAIASDDDDDNDNTPEPPAPPVSR